MMMEGDGRWVINLGNSICGVSLLVLPYCFSQCGVLLGGILLISASLLTLWSTHLLVDCIFEKKSPSCEGIAFILYGKYGKLLLEVSSALFMIGTCSAFFVIIADLAPVVFAWVTSVPPDAPYLRIVILFSLAVSIIFPLSLLRQLDSLSSLSTASLGFYAWLTIQLIINALQKVGASDFSLWKTSGILHTVPIYAMSFSCHLQLVAVIKEIVGEVHEGDIESRLRVKRILTRAILMVAVVYGSAALFGHIAFSGSGVKGDILANFDNGLMAQMTRIGFVLSVVVSFPFMVNPCRSTVYSFLYGKTENYISNPKHFYITLGIITTSFFVAVVTPNIELVLALTGSVCGAIICFIFPSLSYLSTIKDKNGDSWKALVVLLVGMFLLFGGTISALMPTTSSTSLQGQHNVIEELGVKPGPVIGGKGIVMDHNGPVPPIGKGLKETLKDEKDSIQANVINNKEPLKPVRGLASEKQSAPTEQQLNNKSKEKQSQLDDKPLPGPVKADIPQEPVQNVQNPVQNAQEPVKSVQDKGQNAVQEPVKKEQEPAGQQELPDAKLKEPVKRSLKEQHEEGRQRLKADPIVDQNNASKPAEPAAFSEKKNGSLRNRGNNTNKTKDAVQKIDMK